MKILFCTIHVTFIYILFVNHILFTSIIVINIYKAAHKRVLSLNMFGSFSTLLGKIKELR